MPSQATTARWRLAVAHALVIGLLMLTTGVAAPIKNSDCPNEFSDTECDMWAGAGECHANPGFMRTKCARSCGTCGWRNTYCDKRNNEPAKLEGDIVGAFKRAITLPGFKPTVHSTDPYVVTFDDFVSDEEADAFLQTTKDHFERSLAGDVVSPVRTSKQAWCQMSPCVDHPLINRVHERVVNVTGVPRNNAEFFQVLKYEPGQFYRQHHDQNTHPDSLSGVRLFTFFIYLAEPKSGGETNFPKLNIMVQPKRGRALWWPNVMDNDVRNSDLRTDHEAMPPREGEKYSANLWLHQHDFRGPNTHGCEMGKPMPVVDIKGPEDWEDQAGDAKVEL